MAAGYCEYGTETCCGVTHPSLVCSCSGGHWACYYTDACFIPFCPDAMDSDTDPGSDAGPGPGEDVEQPSGPTNLLAAGCPPSSGS